MELYLLGAVQAPAALGSLVLVVLLTTLSSLIVANLTGSVELGFLNIGFLGDVGDFAIMFRVNIFRMITYLGLIALSVSGCANQASDIGEQIQLED